MHLQGSDRVAMRSSIKKLVCTRLGQYNTDLDPVDALKTGEIGGKSEEKKLLKIFLKFRVSCKLSMMVDGNSSFGLIGRDGSFGSGEGRLKIRRPWFETFIERVGGSSSNSDDADSSVGEATSEIPVGRTVPESVVKSFSPKMLSRKALASEVTSSGTSRISAEKNENRDGIADTQRQSGETHSDKTGEAANRGTKNGGRR